MPEFSSIRPLLDLLQTGLPIIQAPMAGTSSPALSAAVANSGALGSIAVGATNAPGAQRMIAEFRGSSSRSLNVNVFCHRPPPKRHAIVEAAWIERLRPEFRRFDADPPSQLQEIYRSFVEDDDMLALLLSAKPRVVSFHFGVPSIERIRALRGRNCDSRFGDEPRGGPRCSACGGPRCSGSRL